MWVYITDCTLANYHAYCALSCVGAVDMHRSQMLNIVCRHTDTTAVVRELRSKYNFLIFITYISVKRQKEHAPGARKGRRIDRSRGPSSC